MAVESITPPPVLDLEGTLARFGGDKQLFVEMTGILLEDAPRLIEELGTAIVAKNASDVRARAHSIKGLLAGCGGVRAAKVAQALEDAGSRGDLSQTDSLVETLAAEFEQLERALNECRG